MSLFKTIGLSLAALALGIAAVPMFAMAQAANPCPFNFANGPLYCGTGTLQVYVQTLQPGAATPYTSGSFTVQVSGLNPSPASFAGSLNGTLVTLGAGAYSVAVNGNQYGFQPSYSQGCTGTVYNGSTATCVVTMTSTAGYNPYVIPYPGPYAVPQLTCNPSYQTVNLGQTVTFTAQGGTGAIYNWSTPTGGYATAGGPVYTSMFSQSGTQIVSVANGNQTATCTVNVLAQNGPVIYPGTPAIPPSVTQTYYPAPMLPNTGFEPTNGAAFALAAVLFIAAGLAFYPYVRKALVTIAR